MTYTYQSPKVKIICGISSTIPHGAHRPKYTLKELAEKFKVHHDCLRGRMTNGAHAAEAPQPEFRVGVHGQNRYDLKAFTAWWKKYYGENHG